VNPLDDGYDDDELKNGTAAANSTNATETDSTWGINNSEDSDWGDFIPWSNQSKTPIHEDIEVKKPAENLDDWDKEMNNFKVKADSALFLM